MIYKIGKNKKAGGKMSNRLYDYLEISDLKDMLNKTKKLYANRPAYKKNIKLLRIQKYEI